MKKSICIILTVVLLVFLAACTPAAEAPASEAPASEAPASEAPASEAPASEAPASEEPASEAPAESINIVFGFWGDSGEQDAYAEAIKGIEEAVPGVTVELAKYPTTSDFWNNLPGQIAAGTAPDIVASTNEGHMTYVTEGIFLPLSDYGIDTTGINPGAIDAWTYEGSLYGLPTTSAPAVFIVNMDMWEAAGLGELPTTWEEVYTAAQALTNDEQWGLCIDMAQAFATTQFVNSYGGSWGMGASINSPENVMALEYILKAFDEGLAVNPIDLSHTWDGETMSAGQAAMTPGGDWYVSWMAESAPDINYAIIPMPGGNGQHGSTQHVTALSVLNHTKNPEIAAKVVQYMAREDAQKAMGTLSTYQPSLLSLRDWYFEQNPILADTKDAGEVATDFAYPVQTTEFMNDLRTLFEENYKGGATKTAQEMLDELQEKYGI